MTVKDILRKYSLPSDAMSTKDEKHQLLDEITRYQAKSRAIYFATAALALALFILALILVAQDVRAGSNKLVPILSGSGIGLAALLEVMRRAAHEWAQAGLVRGAAKGADLSRLQILIDLLLKS